jgi:hypothetical protein
MVVTASELCQNTYRLLDQVLETGVPLEIGRHGRRSCRHLPLAWWAE